MDGRRGRPHWETTMIQKQNSAIIQASAGDCHTEHCENRTKKQKEK